MIRPTTPADADGVLALAVFARPRAFYRALGFDEEARVRDFYQAGEDKVVFRKALAAREG